MEQTLPTAEEIDAVLVEKEEDMFGEFTDPAEREIAGRLTASVLPKLADKANKQAQATYAKRLDGEVAELVTENKKRMQEELDKIKKAAEPLSSEEIAKLLSQEYLEFTVKIRERGRTEERVFAIRELPVAQEKKLLSTLQRVLSGSLKDLTSLDWTTTMTNMEKLLRLVEAIPGALDALAECCATCLDPFGEDKDISTLWVVDNLNVFRMYSILQAQAAASRWRDFFLLAYQAIPK